MNMRIKTGIAMYTVHHAVAKDISNTFVKLSAMGYQGVEFFGELEKFPEKQVKGALQAGGLVITGWHLDWKRLQEGLFYKTVKHLLNCGCTMAVVQCLGGRWNVGHGPNGECRDRWLYYAEWMNRVSEQLNREGLRLAYHNHEHEFALHYDGKTVYDLLYENLSPEIVMELDSGNCMEGGAHPAQVIEKYKERPMILHLKPYSPKKGFEVVLGDSEDANDWKAILRSSGKQSEWILVESENTAMPEMENAGRCLTNLKTYLAQEADG